MTYFVILHTENNIIVARVPLMLSATVTCFCKAIIIGQVHALAHKDLLTKQIFPFYCSAEHIYEYLRCSAYKL